MSELAAPLFAATSWSSLWISRSPVRNAPCSPETSVCLRLTRCTGSSNEYIPLPTTNRRTSATRSSTRVKPRRFGPSMATSAEQGSVQRVRLGAATGLIGDDHPCLPTGAGAGDSPGRGVSAGAAPGSVHQGGGALGRGGVGLVPERVQRRLGERVGSRLPLAGVHHLRHPARGTGKGEDPDREQHDRDQHLDDGEPPAIGHRMTLPELLITTESVIAARVTT